MRGQTAGRWLPRDARAWASNSRVPSGSRPPFAKYSRQIAVPSTNAGGTGKPSCASRSSPEAFEPIAARREALAASTAGAGAAGAAAPDPRVAPDPRLSDAAVPAVAPRAALPGRIVLGRIKNRCWRCRSRRIHPVRTSLSRWSRSLSAPSAKPSAALSSACPKRARADGRS